MERWFAGFWRSPSETVEQRKDRAWLNVTTRSDGTVAGRDRATVVTGWVAWRAFWTDRVLPLSTAALEDRKTQSLP